MKTDEKEKKKSILPKILIGGVVLAGAVVITCLLRNNIKLRKQNWNYEGQLKNQEHVISGLHRALERTSYINGKLSKVRQ